MINLIGSYEVKADAKGRVMIPSGLRKQIQPILNEGFILKRSVLSQLKSDGYKVFIFETTWLAVEPGNTRETLENGFAVINSNGTELNIYHFWGE